MHLVIPGSASVVVTSDDKI